MVYLTSPPVSMVYLDATAAGHPKDSVAGKSPSTSSLSQWRRWIAKPRRIKTRVGSSQINNSLFKCPILVPRLLLDRVLQQKQYPSDRQKTVALPISAACRLLAQLAP